MKSFIKSQFGHCLLIWMFESSGLNNEINRLRKTALRITYNEKSSSYGELLTKDISITMHHRNIRAFYSRNLQSDAGNFPAWCLCHVSVIMNFVEITFKREEELNQ